MTEVEASFQRMHESAQKLGKEIVELEHSLDQKFQREELDSQSLHEMVAQIGTLRGQLRGVHLAAHLEMRKLLTHDQIHRYVQARGYALDSANASGPARIR